MTEYRQAPDSEPRGRHAQRQPARHASAQADTRQERPAAQQTGGHSSPRRERPVQSANARSSEPSRDLPRQGAVRPTPADPYRRPPQGAYRPVQTSHARSGAPGGKRGKGGSEKGGPWRIVFWIALAVLVVALVALGAIGISYWQGQKAYDDVASQVFEAPDDIEETPLSDVTVDWDALKAINPDTVGWIYIPGTTVNYPIVHTTDNERYLTHDFQGSEGWIATFGAIFLSAENAADFSDPNNIIYGHHLNNGSMFAAVAGFADATQFNEHRTIFILTPEGNYRLSTFSLVHCSADDPLVQTTFSDDAERTLYVQDKIDRSVVTPDGDVPDAADVTHLFALATCDNLPSDGRYVLFCSVSESSVAGSDGSTDGSVVDQDAASAIDNAAKEIA